MSEELRVHIRYYNKVGIEVPSVTKVIGLLDRPAFVKSAWKLGIRGLDYRKVWDKSANIGIISHYLMECNIAGIVAGLSEYRPADVDKARNAFRAFLEWKNTHHFRTVGSIGCDGKFHLSEIPLVSEELQCGGTLDWVVEVDGTSLWLVDFKTSAKIFKGVFPGMEYQVAAYKQLWDENHPGVEIDRCHILRLGFEDGSCNDEELPPSLALELAIFKELLTTYTLIEKKNRGEWEEEEELRYGPQEEE